MSKAIYGHLAGADAALLAEVHLLRRRCPWDRKQTVASTRPMLLN